MSSVLVLALFAALFGLVYGGALPERWGTDAAALELPEGPRPGMSLYKGGVIPYASTAQAPLFFYRPRMLGDVRPVVQVGPVVPSTRPLSLGGLKETRERQYSPPPASSTDPAAAVLYNSPSTGYYYPHSNGYTGLNGYQYSYVLPYYYGTTIGYGYGFPQAPAAGSQVVV